MLFRVQSRSCRFLRIKRNSLLPKVSAILLLGSQAGICGCLQVIIIHNKGTGDEVRPEAHAFEGLEALAELSDLQEHPEQSSRCLARPYVMQLCNCNNQAQLCIKLPMQSSL